MEFKGKCDNIKCMNRHELREHLVSCIYQHLLLEKDLYNCIENTFDDLNNIDEFVSLIANDLKKNEKAYIDEISKYLKDWSFGRLCYVDQAILLLSVAELKLALNDKAVIINEAIIISKKFSEEESYRYINGVLDRI